jgi:hypothetical protein
MSPIRALKPPPPPPSKYRIEKYRRTRFWGIYDGETLIVVTTYKRGARIVVAILDELDQKKRVLEGLRLISDLVEPINPRPQMVADRRRS